MRKCQATRTCKANSSLPDASAATTMLSTSFLLRSLLAPIGPPPKLALLRLAPLMVAFTVSVSHSFVRPKWTPAHLMWEM